MSEGLRLKDCCCSFLPDLTCEDRAEDARHLYTGGSAIGLLDSSLETCHLIFIGGGAVKCNIWPRSFNHTRF